MKFRLFVAALVALLCGPVFAAAPPMDIPVYPGGDSTMEINLTNEDLLPTLKALLPMVKFSGSDKIDIDEIGAALKDVTRIEMRQVDVTKTATQAQVADFYAQKAPATDWNRVFWQKESKMGQVAVYVQGQGEKIYGFRLQSIVEDGKPVKRVQIVKTEGKIDYMKLMSIASKLLAPQ